MGIAPPQSKLPRILSQIMFEMTERSMYAVFYDEDGWKAKDIHLSNHGNPKHHSFGEHGEHIDLYEWNEDGSVKRIERRELTDDERKENEDIL